LDDPFFLYVKLLRSSSSRSDFISFVYNLYDERLLAKYVKAMKKVVDALHNRAFEIQSKMDEENESKEQQDMCEKNDLTISKKPQDAFPVTWKQKERIRKYLKKLDLDGLKKYVKGKNVNFNYVHRDFTSLYPVIDATANDKDGKRFMQFLDFMTKHGFDVQMLNFSKVNPLFESVFCTNFNALKELTKRGTSLNVKFVGKNLLLYAYGKLNYFNEITPEQRQSRKDLVRKKQRAAKVLKTQIIPYLKSLKDPKTGEPLFKE
jgi:hypothetical protein